MTAWLHLSRARVLAGHGCRSPAPQALPQQGRLEGRWCKRKKKIIRLALGPSGLVAFSKVPRNSCSSHGAAGLSGGWQLAPPRKRGWVLETGGVKGHKVFLAIAQQPGHPRKKQKPFAGKCQAPRCQCLMKTFAITMIIL